MWLYDSTRMKFCMSRCPRHREPKLKIGDGFWHVREGDLASLDWWYDGSYLLSRMGRGKNGPIAGWLVEDGPHTFASSPEPCDNDVNELRHARPIAKYRIKEKCHDPMPNRVSRRLQEVPSILSLSLERCHRRLPETRRIADQASS